VYLLVFHAYINEMHSSRSKIPSKKSRQAALLGGINFGVKGLIKPRGKEPPLRSAIEGWMYPSPGVHLKEPSSKRQWNSACSSHSATPQVCYAALLYTHHK
jgi:hypothetical protein